LTPGRGKIQTIGERDSVSRRREQTRGTQDVGTEIGPKTVVKDTHELTNEMNKHSAEGRFLGVCWGLARVGGSKDHELHQRG